MKLNECYLPDGVAGPGAVQDGGEQKRRPQHLPRREQGLGLRARTPRRPGTRLEISQPFIIQLPRRPLPAKFNSLT